MKNRGFYVFTRTVFYNNYLSVITVTLFYILGTSYVIIDELFYMRSSVGYRAFHFSKDLKINYMEPGRMKLKKTSLLYIGDFINSGYNFHIKK